MTKNPQLPTTLSVEEVAPFFIEEGHRPKLATPRILRRIDYRGSRYYFEMEGEKPVFYLSVSSFTKKYLPTSPYLIDWRIRLGKDESKEAAQLAADYGTFLHILIAEFLSSGSYDHLETPTKLIEYMLSNGIAQKYYPLWLADIENDMLSFAQFCYEREVRPIAIEYPLAFSEGLAGMIDLVCEMLWNGSTVLSMVDFKSGRKGFWESHELQLHAYKRIWNESFLPMDLEVTHVFNWSPKDWRKKPTYNLKNQTDSTMAQKLPQYLEIFSIDGGRTPSRTYKSQTAPLTLGAPIDGKFEVRTMEEIAIEKSKPQTNA
jgi:hypothetical protein